ncbi:hypothetical protein DFP97_107226 [Paenibacillus prosopidis]|uniref:Uncharacterized protein n=1 Tax=Paenibacillus prosopidis TaxID=630520 RepID=A0A368W0W0_9BACL|nr:hypothetical protein DFP97_107226 [Paenibacillus prosopidis]
MHIRDRARKSKLYSEGTHFDVPNSCLRREAFLAQINLISGEVLVEKLTLHHENCALQVD